MTVPNGAEGGVASTEQTSSSRFVAPDEKNSYIFSKASASPKDRGGNALLILCTANTTRKLQSWLPLTMKKQLLHPLL
ncbi:hypothetical protein GW17_00011153 [Ensete ventricosum]|nr:hypothetical protein GW17_00011153 [Ensete ventricosum]RZS08178.1 hypothetical protein BHM03_00039118 [Ensete ventricosum]